jgi:hypothetical protein
LCKKEELSWTPNDLSNSQLDRRDMARTHVPYLDYIAIACLREAKSVP